MFSVSDREVITMLSFRSGQMMGQFASEHRFRRVNSPLCLASDIDLVQPHRDEAVCSQMRSTVLKRLSNTPPIAGSEKSPVYLRVAMTLGTIAALAAMVAIAIQPQDFAVTEHTMHHMAVGSDQAAVGRPQTTVKPISCEPLPNVPGKSITVAVVDYPPDAYTPRHRHPGSVSAFVLKGTLRSQLEGVPVGTYQAGETWFEPPGTLHVFAENASKTEPAELLATFISDSDCGPLIIPD